MRLPLLLRWEEGRGSGLNWLSYGCVAVAGLHAAVALGFLTLGRVSLPSHDTWIFLKHIVDEGGILPAAWKQYENHRMVVVSLLTYADMSLFGGRCWSGFVILLAGFGGFFIYLARAIPRQLGSDAVAWRLAYAMALALVFALTNAEGFVWPYRAWVPLTLLLAALTFFVFARQETEPVVAKRPPLLAAVLSLAVTATYTGAPGLLIWPALVVTALLLRSPFRTQLTIWVVGIATLAAFLHGTSGFFGYGRGGFANLLDPFHFVKSLVTVIGAPIASTLFVAPLSQFSLPFAIVIGSGALLATAAIGIEALLRPPRDRGEIALLGIMVFSLGWVVTSVIKHQPLPPAPWTPLAKSSDYMATMVFWAALTARLTLAAGRSREPWLLRAGVGAGLATILLLIPLDVQSGLRQITFKHEVRLGNLAFLAFVREAEHPSAQELDYESFPAVRVWLRDRALPPLDRELTRTIGRSLPGLDNLTTTCDGWLSGVHPVQAGIRLWGYWADLTRAPDLMILAVSPAGIAAGVGEAFPRLILPPRVWLEGLPDHGGWVAYAGSSEPGGVTLYGATPAGRILCRFDAGPISAS